MMFFFITFIPAKAETTTVKTSKEQFCLEGVPTYLLIPGSFGEAKKVYVEDASVVSAKAAGSRESEVDEDEYDAAIYVKGLKKGSTYITCEVETYDDDDNKIMVTYRFKLTVKSGAEAGKEAKALYKKYAAKKKSSTLFAVVDLNQDKIPELIIGGRLYYYNYTNGKIKATSVQNIKKLYYSKSKLSWLCVGNGYDRWEKKDTAYRIYQGSKTKLDFLNLKKDYAKLSKNNWRLKDKKFSGRKQFLKTGHAEHIGQVTIPVKKVTIDKKIKSMLPGKKTVNFYKNTKTNRNKYFK